MVQEGTVTADYLYFGLHLRIENRRLCVVDPDKIERHSNEWTAQEMQVISAWFQLKPSERKAFRVARDAKCLEVGCEYPLHITASGRPGNRCTMHAQLFHNFRRRKKRHEERIASRSTKPPKPVIPPKPKKPEYPCATCKTLMPSPRFETCTKCRREVRLAAALARHNARLEAKAAAEEAARRKAEEAAKPIDYASASGIEKFVCCKWCVKYVPRSEAVAKIYCSEKCHASARLRRRGYDDKRNTEYSAYE